MPDEKSQRAAQQKDIAARTRGAESSEWRGAMREKHAPYDVTGGPPPSSSAHYAVEGLKGNVAARMRKQGEEAVKGGYKRGGPVRKTGPAMVHRGERVLTKRQAKRYAKRGGRK